MELSATSTGFPPAAAAAAAQLHAGKAIAPGTRLFSSLFVHTPGHLQDTFPLGDEFGRRGKLEHQACTPLIQTGEVHVRFMDLHRGATAKAFCPSGKVHLATVPALPVTCIWHSI